MEVLNTVSSQGFKVIGKVSVYPCCVGFLFNPFNAEAYLLSSNVQGHKDF